MHITWINTHGSLVGGAEHYIKGTAEHLQKRGIRSTLLYDPNHPTSPTMLDAFDAAFPLVDVLTQLNDLNADLVYMHQTRRPQLAEALANSTTPVVECFHDHWLFCLRVQKYTTIGRQTCTRTASATSCYPCLGFVHRKTEFPKIGLRTISDLQAEHGARRHFAGFVTGSSYMAEQAVSHGFDPAKVHVTPLYAEPPMDTRASDDQREPYRLLFVGAILQYKGVDVLIEALSHTVFPVLLDLVGEGSFMHEIQALVDKLGLRNRVAFHGKLSREDIGAFYRRATCLVLPSRTPESFGIVGAEAMSYGLPVIASDIGGALEWLLPGKTGLTFPINDARALARMIDIITNNAALARAMGKAAIKRYQEHFRPEHHVERLLEVFTNILQQRGRS